MKEVENSTTAENYGMSSIRPQSIYVSRVRTATVQVGATRTSLDSRHYDALLSIVVICCC
jgi:hypothetical protein